jgi:CRP/FNR family cyclic AMP-dependent transcriptional regulator
MNKTQPTSFPSSNDPHKLLARTGIGRTTEDYRSSQNVFSQGEGANSVFFIQKGRVKLTATSEHGKEAVVGILDEGQFFGEGCLQGQPMRSATATALGDCSITSITTAAMRSAIRDPRSAQILQTGNRPFTVLLVGHFYIGYGPSRRRK